MVDLTREMAELMRGLNRAMGKPSATMGRAILFVSAYNGEGVSTVAREFARTEAAFAKRPVWLVDADLKAQGQLVAMGTEPKRFGPAGPLCAATPDGSAFFAITPPARDRDGHMVPDAKFLVARPFFDGKLWVTRFREQNLSKGQTVKLFTQTSYWQALRQHAQTIVVDVPSADRSDAALKLAPLMDAVVMVVSEPDGDLSARLALKADIEAAGGQFAGMVYNRARAAKRA
jgi:Mrp family chromosome partitioning ATPase